MLPSRHRPDVLEARLTAFARDTALYAEGNLAARAVVLDTIHQVYQLLQLYRRDAQWGRYLRTLTHQAKTLEKRLRQADAEFFQTLRRHIRTDVESAETLRHLFDRHTRYRPGRSGHIHRGYDTLDALVQGLMRAEEAPAAGHPRERDMIHYEPTPARAILDVVDQLQLGPDEVFYDVGAGLGHVAILVHLLTRVVVRGVEIDAAYCRHARRCAEELGLLQVRFLHRDARYVDYADGTVFFLYTPFTGKLLDTVLAIFAAHARRRPITLCTYGACTFEVARQPWLRLRRPEAEHAYAVAVFTSL